MIEWENERLHERINEWTIKNEWMDKLINQCMNEILNECMCKVFQFEAAKRNICIAVQEKVKIMFAAFW